MLRHEARHWADAELTVMAGIADTNTNDLVAQDADGTYLLVMTKDR